LTAVIALCLRALGGSALAALQRAEIAKWWPIIKAANIRGE
jgi:hypothetical protein